MGIRTKYAIEIGVKKHIEIVSASHEQKLTASLLTAGEDKKYRIQTTAVYEPNGDHAEDKLLRLFNERLAGSKEALSLTKYVHLYTYYCPCFNCKEKWKNVPQQFKEIKFKWAFCQWYIPPPATYGRYNDLANAQGHMREMVGLGWSMRQYSTTITANTLTSIDMVAKIT